jgi:DNA-directed RNA polymerase specialized sigma24 family protein
MIEKPDSGLGTTGPGMAPAVSDVDVWFGREILPLEAALMEFLQHNWRNRADLTDFRQDVYVRVYQAAQKQIPDHPRQFLSPPRATC